MRCLAFAALCLLLAVPATSAQAPQGILDLQVDAPSDPVGEEGAQVIVTMRRLCPNPVAILPDEVVALQFRGPAGSVFDGPESLVLASRSCLGQAAEEHEAPFRVLLPSDANASSDFQYGVVAESRRSFDPLMPPSYPAHADFVLRSPKAPEDLQVFAQAEATRQECIDTLADHAEEAGVAEGVANVPGPGWLVPLVGLGLAGLARRRLT